MKLPAKPRNPDSIGDIKFRNGVIIRGKRAGNYRFGQWPDGPHDYDIVKWQPIN